MMVTTRAPDRVIDFLRKHSDPTRVWKIWDVQKAMAKETLHTYAYGTIQGALSLLCKEGYVFRVEKGLYQLSTEENKNAFQKEQEKQAKLPETNRRYFAPSVYLGPGDERGAEAMKRWRRHRWQLKEEMETTMSAPVEAVFQPDKEVVTVTKDYYDDLCDKERELDLIKTKLHAVVVGATYDTHKETVRRVRVLITEPELTKLQRYKRERGELRPKYPADITKAVLDLNLSECMRRALITDLQEMPRATVRALRDRDLITVTPQNPGGAPYIKTRMGERVSAFLKLTESQAL